MIIKTERHYLDCMCAALLNYFPLLQLTLLRQVQGYNKVAAEYLQNRIIISVLGELELILRKKQINTISKSLTLKFTDAQGIILYKTILDMPVQAENYYGNLVRNAWLKQLDQQIIYDLNIHS